MKGGRVWAFVTFAVLAAALFVRLGIWQLRRRTERRARNALILSRLDSAETTPVALPRDTSLAHYRRMRVTGIPDYAHEIVWAARSFRGSPGVNLLTPMRVPGSDTAVLVDRGWVYAPDGATVDLAKWHDRDSTFTGYVEELPSSGGSAYTGKTNIVARLSTQVIANALPYPVAPVYVVALSDSTMAADRIARLSIPALDEGPHMGYALQWFAFATIALIGAVVVVMGGRSGATEPRSP